MKFKVGDRIQINDTGPVGTVIGVEGPRVQMQWDGEYLKQYDNDWFYSTNFSLIERPNMPDLVDPLFTLEEITDGVM